MEAIKQYLSQKNVQSMLQEIVQHLCTCQPDDVPSSIIEFLNTKYSSNDELVKYEDEEVEIEEEDEGVGEIEEQPKFQPGARRRRSAVSAESVSPDEIRNSPKVVVEKSDKDRKTIADKLSQNILFSSLDDDAATDLVNAVCEKKFSAGDVVMAQGDDGDYFYIIEEGETHIFVKVEGEDKKVLECGPGDSFGELALMYNAPRAATVKAVTDLRCWAVERSTFKLTLMESTINKRDRYEKFLQSVPILDTLYRYEKLTIADALVAEHYKEGDIVMKEGDAGDKFYIIEKGSVDFTQTTDTGDETLVGQCAMGDYFGEIALLTNKTRAATAKCTSDCSFLTVDRKTFVRVMGPLDVILKRNLSKYKSWMENNQG